MAIVVVLTGGCLASPEPIPQAPQSTPEVTQPPSDVSEPAEPSYIFEPDWWLKPQTYGMFNYWGNTNFDRLRATGCTANGYRLVFDFNLKNPEFDFEKDIEEAHKRGLKYVIGICLNGIIDKCPNEVAELASKGALAVTYEGKEAVQHEGETVYYFSTNHPLWQETLIKQGKRIVDLNADGIAVIAPWGSSFYPAFRGIPDFSTASIEGFRAYLSRKYTNQQLTVKGISDLQTFNYLEYLHSKGIQENKLSSAPLYEEYCEFQRECSFEFYRRFGSEVKEHARAKGIGDFPVVPAGHGEWLVPLTLNFFPLSNFAFANLELEELYSHTEEYKLHHAATGGPLITSPVDASFGWLVQSSPKPEDMIQIQMAEAYANKGAFQDQYQAGLTEQGFIDYSIDAQVIKKVNSFYLNHEDLFDIGSQSLAKVAELLSAKSVTSVESEHWNMFRKVSQVLTRAHFQYDVILSEDSSLAPNTLTLERLESYEVIILPGNDRLDNNVASLLTEYLTRGGKLVIINKVDPGLSLPDGSSYVVLNWEPDLAKGNWGKNREFLDTLNNMLSGRVSEDTLPKEVGIQIWQGDNKIVAHLVNYDFDLAEGVIEKKDVPVSVNLPLLEKPSGVKILSPGSEEEQIMDYAFSGSRLRFVVPQLRTWAILVIE
jgi:hypothetical protein